MADVLGPDAKVHTGIWTDWSKSKPWGLTLTLSPTTAVILTNSLSIFITVAGVQLWTILRYLLHRHGTTNPAAMPTPHLQKQQFILRNAASALETAHLMLDIAWTSRRSSGRRSRRAFAIGSMAALYSVGLMVAGIFSDQIISATAPDGKFWTLSTNERCGIFNVTYLDIVENSLTRDPEEFEMMVEYQKTLQQDALSDTQYSQQCYSNESLSPSSSMSSICHTLRQPRLRWFTVNVQCPFSPELCQSDTISMETGMIDSHRDLGVNAEPEDRIQYRRVSTCTVLNGTDRTRGWDGHVVNSSSSRPEAESARVFYGPSMYRDTPWTHSFANFVSFYDNSSRGDPYQVDVFASYAVVGNESNSGDFVPIPELRQNSGDVALAFLSYTGTYFDPVDDPWFSAHRLGSYDVPSSFLATRYEKDFAISTIGCVEQHQFCTSSGCTDLLGFNQVQNVEKFNKSLTPKQNATFDRLVRAVDQSTLRSTADILSSTPAKLLASNATAGGRSGAMVAKAVPNHQWKLELENWQSISLARLQRQVGKWASGTISPQPQYLLKPSLDEDIWFCNNFMVLSSSFKSFSVVAISFTFVLGIIIIFTGMFIESIGRGLQKVFTKSPPESHWSYDDLLGLQRSSTKCERAPIPPPKDQRYWNEQIHRDHALLANQGSKNEMLQKAVSPPEYTASPVIQQLGTGPRVEQRPLSGALDRRSIFCSMTMSAANCRKAHGYRVSELHISDRSRCGAGKHEKAVEHSQWV